VDERLRVAALFDIHGNLPALDAVLEEVRQAGVDRIVAGGDVILGPMPRETLRRLLDFEKPVQFIHGNCELAVLAQMAAPEPAAATYWGTVSGKPLPEELLEGYRWTAQQLQSEYKSLLASWPRTLHLDISGLGEVLFCHATPRSETEVFTRLTAEDRLVPLFEPLRVAVIVCGHTHMQFDRRIGTTHVVNAGSVGTPFGNPGAAWALLGPDVQLRNTLYDLEHVAKLIRATHYPQAEEVAHDIVHPPSESEMLELFGGVELK
jgi:predicted phosphodiesterase